MSAVSLHLNWRSINHPVKQQRLVNGTCEIKLKERSKEKDNYLAGVIELMHSKIYKNAFSSEYL